MDNRITFDYNYLMEGFVEDGISEKEVAELETKFETALKVLDEKRADGINTFTAWMDLPYSQDEIVADILKTADDIKAKFDNFVVLGIGGSALGPIAVQQALNHIYYNDLTKEARNGCPRLYVIDNVDPERMKALFDVIDIEKTMFNVITKSGSTSETMSQYLLVRDMLMTKLGDKYIDNIIVTTDAVKGNLAKICKTEPFKKFIVPDGVGGRFSELCPVGLLPAAVCGIDIVGMLKGAAEMDVICHNKNMYKNPAAMFAVQQVIAMEKGKNISVMMPYADSLKYIADWYAQLWAESLGKKFDNNGNVVYKGQTPVKAIGVTDQHSQVQLYTEGPSDKVITFVGVENYRDTLEIPGGYDDIPSLSFLKGHTFNELILSEQSATEYAINASKKWSRTITLSKLNANTLGQLLYFFEMETAFAGELMDINAYDQPGVEEGKNATYALMGREGYEAKKAELDSKKAKSADFII